MSRKPGLVMVQEHSASVLWRQVYDYIVDFAFQLQETRYKRHCRSKVMGSIASDLSMEFLS